MALTTRTESRRIFDLAFDGGKLLPVGFDGSPPEGPFLKAREVAERLDVTPRWVTDKHSSGHLTGYRLPGSNRLRFAWPEVVACLEKNGGK